MALNRLRMNSLLGVGLLVGILCMMNFLAIRHGGRWDLSETQRFSLAPQTLRVIGELRQTVKITVFSHDRSQGYRAYRDLLETYSYGNPFIQVSFVDPEHRPGLAEKYGISRLDTAVLESGSQTIQITKPMEVEITNALIRVTQETKKTIGFLEGHGERDIEDRERNGYSRVREILLAQGYEVDRLSLQEEGNIPDDLSVLVIAGPRHHLPPEEQELVTHYLRAKGRALIMIDPETTSGLKPFLAQLGLTLDPGIVVDEQDRLAQGSPTALLVRTFTDHDITHNFEVPVMLPVSRHLIFNEHNELGWKFMPLAQTSKNSWVETNFTDKMPTLDPDHDMPGPLVLSAVLEPQSSATNQNSRPAMVVIGNSAFASNTYIKFPGNTDFLLNAIAWLADEQKLVSLTAKDPALRPFIPNPTQEHMLLAIQVFSVPLLLLFLGLTIWRRRRHL